MKQLLLTLIFLASTCGVAFAEEHNHPAKTYSKEFEKLKGLAGKWEGTTSDDNEISVEYRISSGGSVIVETLSPGSDKEMISVYHDKAGKLTMTHYCMLGNQPQLEVIKSDEKSIVFDYSKNSQLDLSKELHMHALNISFIDPDTIVEIWTANDATGKQTKPTVLKLKRSN